jgi:GNAT superfamily N-acetyltransferase
LPSTAEKVLENALKPNTAFVSLYEEDPDRKGQPGVELENIEVIFTDQGLYLYKLYSNGHPYDTSLVWVQFLKSILAANLVPSVIVPAQFPNSRVFNFLESFVAPEISGRILTVRDDYFEEAGVESYYDFKVEKVKQGDIILEPSIVEQLQLPDMSFRDVLRTSSGRTRLKSSTGIEPAAQPQQPRANKPAAKVQIEQDLVGRLLTSVMKSLKAEIADEQKHPGMQGLSFLVEGTARFLSSFVNKYVEEGILDPVILSTGFDLDQWNRKKKGKNNRAVLTESHRDELVKMMFSLVRAEMSLLRKSETMREMFQNPARRNNCFDLQSHLQKVMVSSSRKYSSGSAAIHQAGPPGRQGLRNANRGAATQTSSAQTSDTATAATAAQREQAEKDALALAALLNLEEVKQADCLEAMEAWVALNDIMKTCMTTVLLENVDRKPQEQLIKWIFGNEDRVWRDRGGRPGEETLDTFLAFVRPFDQQAIAQPANPPAASGSQSSQPPAAPSSSEPKVEEEDADRTSFAPNHYGQSPFGGFVALATEKLEHVKEISPVQAGAEVVAYCIGDYVAADNFEVVTAWVHPRYRGFGVAVDLYLRTMSEIERRGGRYMTFGMFSFPSYHFVRVLTLFSHRRSAQFVRENGKVFCYRHAAHEVELE